MSRASRKRRRNQSPLFGGAKKVTMMNYHEVAKEIQRLQPGQQCRVSRHALSQLGVPIERILENIVGSAYEYLVENDYETGDCLFRRLDAPLDDGRRTFVSADRLALFRKGSDGYYHPVR